MIIDYRSWNNEESKYTEIELFIDDKCFLLKKNEAMYLWEILDREVGKMWLDKDTVHIKTSPVIERRLANKSKLEK